MKQLFFYCALCLSLCLCGQSALAEKEGQAVTNYKEIKRPALNPIQVRQPERFVMKNGLTVYLLEDHELPLVELGMRIYTGSRWEPVEKAGLAGIVAEVIRSGGSEKFPGDALDDELDQSATSVELGIGQNEGVASVNALKENFGRGLEILSDLLQNPAFPQEKIDLCKQELAGGITRRNDNASAICAREFMSLLRGKGSPYAHPVEFATLAAISREDVVAFHKQFFQPQNMILGICGDFDSAAMKGELEKYFGSWAKGTAPRPTPPAQDLKAAATHGIFLVEKTDVEQSFIRMGHMGGKESDPDYYALILMNDILGGGLSSRLFCNVRSDKGLAYSVGSDWGAGMDVEGTFQASGSTKLASTGEFIKAVRGEIVRMTEGGVTQEELDRSKNSALNGFVFEFDSTDKIINRLMTYEYYGYPADTLEHFQENIAKVTREDILAAAQKHLHPDQLAILVVGNPEKFDVSLDQWGPVTPIDISIPGIPTQQPQGN